MSLKHENTAVRRAQIIEAAGKIIIRRGSEHLTVKGIASEVGISEGDIYRHFKSKKDVLLFLLDSVRDRLLADYVKPGLPGGNGLNLLQNALENHITAISRRGGISFQIIAEIVSLGDKELNTRASTAIEHFTARLEELLITAKSQGDIRGNLDTGTTARAISAMIQGLVNTWVLSNYKFDLKAEFAVIWQTLVTGLSANDREGGSTRPCV